ncbi:hypothetical protein SLEP1_g60477, partial [Rubroshorea leprosula]
GKQQQQNNVETSQNWAAFKQKCSSKKATKTKQ